MIISLKPEQAVAIERDNSSTRILLTASKPRRIVATIEARPDETVEVFYEPNETETRDNLDRVLQLLCNIDINVFMDPNLRGFAEKIDPTGTKALKGFYKMIDHTRELIKELKGE